MVQNPWNLACPLQNNRKPDNLSFEKEHGLSNLQVQIGVLRGV